MGRDVQPERTTLAPGDVVGEKYRVDAVVGRGGTSIVYRARHLTLDRLVAIKLLAPDASAVPECAARLKHEARMAARIRSEHVVRIYDVGALPGHDDLPFIVMEHLEGVDLAALLARRGPLPLGLVVDCILQTCEVLAEAHAAGVVHRDLKPANLFLTDGVDGSPFIKVLDFGISRASRGISPLTDPGVVLGTPSYMAPEQMETAEGVDARSDIWALGAILYELLVGKPAFKGESLPQIFVRIMRSPPPRPSAFRKDLPAAIDAIVARCMAIEPRDRFATVAELARALAEAFGETAREPAERVARVLGRKRGIPFLSALQRYRARRGRVASDWGVGRSAKRLAASIVVVLVGAALGFVLLEPRGTRETAHASVGPDAGVRAPTTPVTTDEAPPPH